MDIRQQIADLREKALRELATVNLSSELEGWRVRYLGKKSQLTEILRGLSARSIEERKEAGALSNTLKIELESAFKIKEESLRESEMTSAGSKDAIDISLPGRPFPRGRLHPVSQALGEISSIFTAMGFQVLEGPEVEWDYYNFDMLNMPKEHPARAATDTFWIDAPPNDKGWQMLLRTHTSPMQVRTMEKVKPPIRIVVPGIVHRYEATDATHLSMFSQIEGLAVDEGIGMADLKGTLHEFARRFFGPDRRVRFRCDFFPYVEPGAEMAVECAVCRGEGCKLCGGSGWIEVLGSGMVHPSVLEGVGIDSKKYSGFAFGMGIERIPLLRYGIEDIRLFYGSDLRFLRQF
ncbi:MAG: phenylalanine--tRNA ligase subunit alpha [Dehalococcoidia bacterium]|nr:MAG: phenylalanine--tRNA ligase subunit alpha [Dehalococcoidia bacterium]